jgi:hypothetical protein
MSSSQIAPKKVIPEKSGFKKPRNFFQSKTGYSEITFFWCILSPRQVHIFESYTKRRIF